MMLKSILNWLAESWAATEDAALWTVDFVEGRVGPFGRYDEQEATSEESEDC